MWRATASQTAPIRGDEAGGHAEQLGFGGVGIGDEAAVNMAEEPGMAVMAAAISPPVQLSAVATVRFLARQMGDELRRRS